MTKPKAAQETKTPPAANQAPENSPPRPEPGDAIAEATSKPTLAVTVKDPMRVLVRFNRNLELVYRWYRNASTRGEDLPHIVAAERIMDQMRRAMSFALEDQDWTAPKFGP